MTRRRRPRTAQERVVGVLGTVAPGSLGGRIRNTRPASVLQPNTGGPPATGFDPDADPIVIGSLAGATSPGGVVVGKNGLSSAADAIAIGENSAAISDSAIAVGASAGGQGLSAIAIGGSALVQGPGGTAADYGIAIGRSAAASAPHAVVIGQESTAAGYYSVAVGTFVYAAGQDSIAMGRSAEVDEDDGIAIGRRSWVQTGHTQSAAFGYNAQTSKPYQIMLGAAVGTSGTPYFVEIAGSGLVLKDSVTGTRYLLRVTSGALALSAAP